MSIHVVWSEYSAVLITTTCWSFQHELGDIQPADVALAVFDFTQNVAEIWRGSKIHQKRSILETLTLNCTLSDVTLVTEKRKPFDVLAKRADWKKSRGDTIRTCDLLLPKHDR